MPKITEGQYALGALTLFALWLFVALPLLYYPSNKSPQNNQRATQSQQQSDGIGDEAPPFIPLKLLTRTGRDQIAAYCAEKTHDQNDDWTHKYICDVKITDAYLAVFNGLLVIVTGGLIIVGFLTIKKMRDTEERQLRAYVSLDPHYDIKPGDTPHYRLSFLNRGQTPAYEFRAWSDGGAIEGSADDQPDSYPINRLNDFVRRTLNPGETTNINASFEKKISANEIKAMSEGKQWIFIWGEAIYRDAFFQERYVRFRFKIGGHSMRLGAGVTICDEGNESN